MVDIKKPVRVPFTKNPLDFKNTVENVEVYIVDVVVDYSASLDMFKNYLVTALNCPEAFVVVVDKNNDPYGQEAEKIIKRDTEIYVPKLSDPFYHSDGATVKANDLYGDEYNQQMLKTMDDYSKEQFEQKKSKSPFTTIKHPKDIG